MQQRRGLGARRLGVVLLGVALALCGLSLPTAHADEAGSFVSLINQARAQRGLDGYRTSGELASVALAQAKRMAKADKLFHNPGLAGSVSNWYKLGENVGSGGSVEVIHNAFMASPSHRENILDSGFTEVGVGVVVRNDGIVFVSEVFRQREYVATSTPKPTPKADTQADTQTYSQGDTEGHQATPSPTSRRREPTPRPSPTRRPRLHLLRRRHRPTTPSPSPKVVPVVAPAPRTPKPTPIVTATATPAPTAAPTPTPSSDPVSAAPARGLGAERTRSPPPAALTARGRPPACRVPSLLGLSALAIALLFASRRLFQV